METYIINTLGIWILFLGCAASFAAPFVCAAEVSRRGYSWWVVVPAGIFAYFCWSLIVLVWFVLWATRVPIKVAVPRS
jgi:hypothetical protein